jgi:hypothetical protein
VWVSVCVCRQELFHTNSAPYKFCQQRVKRQDLPGTHVCFDFFDFFIQVGEHLKPQDLPEAHVCFNQLVLPPSESIQTLKEKLMLAVREGREGFELH